MAEVKVLVEGYAKEIDKGWIASSTACLITTEDKKIITDPGCNREKLLGALKNEGLKTDDIDYVFLTHCHTDHALLAGIFEKAKYITSNASLIYDGDKITVFDKNFLGKDIGIIETPGHVLEHQSLIVNTDKGKIGIAGDLIWWLDHEEQVFRIDQEDHTPAEGISKEEMISSRKRLMEMCDYIIPGHGRMFKVEK